MLYNVHLRLVADGERVDAIIPGKKNQVVLHFELERPMVQFDVELYYQADGEEVLVARRTFYIREEGPYDIPFDLEKQLPAPSSGRARFVAKVKAKPVAGGVEAFKTAELDVKVPNVVVRVGLASSTEVHEYALAEVVRAVREKVGERLPQAEYIATAVSGSGDAPVLDVYFSADLSGGHGSSYGLAGIDWIDWEGLAKLIFTAITGGVIYRLVSAGHPFLAVVVLAIYVVKEVLPWALNVLALDKKAQIAENIDKIVEDAKEAGMDPDDINRLVENVYRITATSMLPFSPPQVLPGLLAKYALIGLGILVGGILVYKLVKWLAGGGKEKVREKIVYVVSPFQRFFAR